MNTKYFCGFVIKINKFHATECHFRTPFRTPIPVNSNFVLLGFNPENFEKVFNSLINSIIEFQSLRKKVVSSA